MISSENKNRISPALLNGAIVAMTCTGIMLALGAYVILYDNGPSWASIFRFKLGCGPLFLKGCTLYLIIDILLPFLITLLLNHIYKKHLGQKGSGLTLPVLSFLAVFYLAVCAVFMRNDFNGITEMLMHRSINPSVELSPEAYVIITSCLAVIISCLVISQSKIITVSVYTVVLLFLMFRLVDNSSGIIILLGGACSLILFKSYALFEGQASSEDTSYKVRNRVSASILLLFIFIMSAILIIYAAIGKLNDTKDPAFQKNTASSESGQIKSESETNVDSNKAEITQIKESTSAAEKRKEEKDEKRVDNKQKQKKKKQQKHKKEGKDLLGCFALPLIIFFIWFFVKLLPEAERFAANRKLKCFMSSCSNSEFAELSFKYLISFLSTAGIRKKRHSDPYRVLTCKLPEEVRCDYINILAVHDDWFYGGKEISGEYRKKTASGIDEITKAVYVSSSFRTRLKLRTHGFF